MKNKPFVYILILNWNCYKETIKCVNMCKKLDYENFCILVLDNNSSDDSAKKLSEHLKDTEFIQTGENLGYAAGNNVGIRHALGKGADYVLILNPDALVSQDLLKKMIDTIADSPTIGICGPRVINGKAPSTFLFDGLSIASNRGYDWQFNIAEAQQEKPVVIDVDCVSGCSMLISRDLLCTIGLLHENFFLYYEDVELCLRAQDHGWRTVICTNTHIIHDENVQVQKYATGFRVERSRILLARMRRNCKLKNLITGQSIQLVLLYLKQKKLLKTSRIMLEIFLGLLCGLIRKKGKTPVID